jgi:hypothetical protein
VADGFELVGAELSGHAGKLDGFTDRLRQAVGAAQQVDPVERYGVDALNKAVDAMEAVAKGVRDTAQAYEGTEDGNTSSFRGGAE